MVSEKGLVKQRIKLPTKTESPSTWKWTVNYTQRFAPSPSAGTPPPRRLPSRWRPGDSNCCALRFSRPPPMRNRRSGILIRRNALLSSAGDSVLQQKNLPLGGFSGYYKTAVCRELFLLQKVPQSARENSLADFPFKRRLNDKVFRALRSSTSRRCPLDTCHLLKKVDENFFLSTNWVPRGKSQGLPPNQ